MAWNDGLDPKSAAHGIAADNSTCIRVVAGPGTGKSFAIKRRIARLLEAGANPKKILPVTFTNVAAEDLQREILQVGVPGCEEIRGSTLHSLGMRILNRQQVLQATGRIARPLNRFELEPLLYDLSPKFGNKRARAKGIRAFEAAWARLQTEEPGYAQTPQDAAFETELISWLRFHRGMLIGEIIPQLYRYLRDNPAAPERSAYDYVLVDEYQDLNKAEQRVTDYLSESGELCIVGDDDQSLYSFKHAHPAGIREFSDTHDGATDHEMLECRRCPTKVVEIANSLIAHNKDRKERKLKPLAENGEGVVEIFQYDTLANEAIGIADYIKSLIEKEGYNAKDFLVLAQRRTVGNPIHEALEGREIPSKSYYQENALDNEAAQERLAILKLFVDNEDRIALRWLIGFGGSNFRTKGYARIRRYCEEHDLSPWSVLDKLATEQIEIAHTGPLVERFKVIRDLLQAMKVAKDMDEFVQVWLQNELEDTDPFHQLVLDTATSVASAPEMLEVIVESVSQPEIPPDISEVRIMSLHKSKGLSSPVVIIAGCIEGLLPTGPDPELSMKENEAALEEQRRLFFVGLTRVKAEVKSKKPGVLRLTSSRMMSLADAMRSGIRPARTKYGRAYVNASQFLAELGPTAPKPKKG